MNREAMLRILNRTQVAGTVALADRPKTGYRTDPAPWNLLTHPPDPRERLTEYLNVWAGMNEAAWPEANVKALYEDIMDIFREYPEAEGWFRDWRKAHAEARLC